MKNLYFVLILLLIANLVHMLSLKSNSEESIVDDELCYELYDENQIS